MAMVMVLAMVTQRAKAMATTPVWVSVTARLPVPGRCTF
jgi:hypothetical protein